MLDYSAMNSTPTESYFLGFIYAQFQTLAVFLYDSIINQIIVLQQRQFFL